MTGTAPSVKAGTCFGRLAVRGSGNITIEQQGVVAQGIPVRHCHLLQRSDGYCYGAVAPSPHSGPVAP